MNIHEALLTVFPAERVLTRDIDCIAYASDASFYRLVPKAVVQPVSIVEIQRLFEFSGRYRIPLTFRAAGTSLSGQAVTDGILVHIAKHWKTLEVLDGGRRVRVGPGVVGAQVNNALRVYGAKLGPDPASINVCMTGGILANNSSGMCCGVKDNSYHTVESLVFVLPSGLVLDTAQPDADEQLYRHAPDLANGLLRLKHHIEEQPALRDRIRAKYRIKNTTGYSLNAFLDYSSPSDILSRLLIGSEGTLGFIAEAVFRTIPDLPLKYTGLLFFATPAAACEAITPLKESGAAALELLDYASLRSVEGKPGVPRYPEPLPTTAAALLVEYQAVSEEEREQYRSAAQVACRDLALLEQPDFTSDVQKQMALWAVRKGLLPSVGGVRESGTTALIEDVAFPVERLAEAVTDLRQVLVRHGYSNAIIFGHAKDGNLHFVITQSFNDDRAVQRYARFMDDLVELVVQRYDGSLKAEHGTGRNIAPFVETEWGAEAYAVMKELKRLVDPLNLLNPGVILNTNPRAHLTDLKTLPSVEKEVDMCIECGYCETVCPSRNLTMTPRQRIVVRREMTRLAEQGVVNFQLNEDYRYSGMDTCAADGVCSLACPVDINTGDLIKQLRTESHSFREGERMVVVARHLAAVETLTKAGLQLGWVASRVLTTPGLNTLIRGMEAVSGIHLPKWNTALPRVRREGVPTRLDLNAEYVYFPTCISRVMGSAPDEDSQPLIETLMKLADRAGISLVISEEPRGLCCGMPFFSKGFSAAGAQCLASTVEALWNLSDHGRLPVVTDASSCAFELHHGGSALDSDVADKWRSMTFMDSIDFAHDVLLPRLHIRRRLERVAVHPVCSVRKAGNGRKLEVLVGTCAETVVMPQQPECCGMAGDRGLLFPELTESATHPEAIDIQREHCDMYVSSNIPCETAMTSAVGERYTSFLYLLEYATRQGL